MNLTPLRLGLVVSRASVENLHSCFQQYCRRFPLCPQQNVCGGALYLSQGIRGSPSYISQSIRCDLGTHEPFCLRQLWQTLPHGFFRHQQNFLCLPLRRQQDSLGFLPRRQQDFLGLLFPSPQDRLGSLLRYQ